MDKYEKIKILGRGAHGIVHLVREFYSGKHLTIKEIPMDSMSASERVAALREVQMLEMFKHPNIIGYNGYFIEGNALCIVMEYAQGGTLARMIVERQGCLFPEEEILDYFAQIVLSLEHLHSRQILHRDLKTCNILLNQTRRVSKLSDFGISKVLKTNSKATTLIGTANYMSPEICEGKSYNIKSDIWSLGCVLYELTALKRAFEGDTFPAIVLKIIRADMDPIPTMYNRELDRMIKSMISLEPDRRPSILQLMAHPLLIAPILKVKCNVGKMPSSRLGRLTAANARQSKLPVTSTVRSSLRRSSIPCGPNATHRVFGWEQDISGIMALPLPTTDTKLTQVCLGSFYKVALSNDGRILVWEEATYMSDVNLESPQYEARFIKSASAPISVAQIACGDKFVACITDHGILLTFGHGSSGCLGHGNFSDVSQPKIVETLVGCSVMQVACGSRHVMALTVEREIYTWGSGEKGRLGLSSLDSFQSPQKVELSNFIFPHSIFCSIDSSVIVGEDGRVFASGNNIHNKIGLWSNGDRQDEKTTVSLSFIEARAIPPLNLNVALDPIAFGPMHTVIISGLDVFTFGSNQKRQLGPRPHRGGSADGMPHKVDFSKVLTPGCSKAVHPIRVQAGDTYSLAYFSDGQLIGWGAMPAIDKRHQPRNIRFPHDLVGCDRYNVIGIACSNANMLTVISCTTV